MKQFALWIAILFCFLFAAPVTARARDTALIGIETGGLDSAAVDFFTPTFGDDSISSLAVGLFWAEFAPDTPVKISDDLRIKSVQVFTLEIGPRFVFSGDGNQYFAFIVTIPIFSEVDANRTKDSASETEAETGAIWGYRIGLELAIFEEFSVLASYRDFSMKKGDVADVNMEALTLGWGWRF